MGATERFVVGSRGPWRLPGSLREGVLAGAVYAFFETLLVYGTGTVLRGDFLTYLAFSLVLWTSFALVLERTLALLCRALGAGIGPSRRG